MRRGGGIVDSDSALANVLEIAVPVVALAIIATPVVIASLKGRWWIGVVGLVAFVGGFAVMFGMFGIEEPSEEFQETVVFGIVNAALSVALLGGLVTLVVAAALRARPSSWWARHRSAEPAAR